MTPREKWRQESISWLKANGIFCFEYHTDEFIMNKLEDMRNVVNYLTSEYIINVKTSDDEKSTEISDNQQQQG